MANSDQTSFFFYPYLIILNMIMVNFFISILDRSYVKIKSILSQRDEKFSLKNVFLFCFYKSNQVKSKGINIETEFEDGNKFEVYTNLKLRFQRANYTFTANLITLMNTLGIKLSRLRLLTTSFSKCIIS